MEGGATRWMIMAGSLAAEENGFCALVAVEELGESESGSGGELLLDRELCGSCVWAESWSLGDLDLDGESEVGFGPDAFALRDINDFDIQGRSRNIGTGLRGEGEVGDNSVDDDVGAD